MFVLKKRRIEIAIMNIEMIEFEMNTCINEKETFVVLYDKTFIPEEKVKSLINKSATRLFDYDLPAFLSCVFMTKTTYEHVFKSLKGRV